VWGGEVEAGVGLGLDVLVAMELGAVVGSDGEDGDGSRVDEVDGDTVELGDGSVAELADDEITDLSLDERDDAGPGGDENGIDLPVAELAAVLDDGGSL